ncbi:hypothetical protein [Acinetobacter sp. MB5]|uniref:hypothetical protein n=1 Tax=Acinetobacter sp. MB5 TaxID=2069438 RepID=UPI000DD0A20E|nr:hypothetical protein [Acinetobacter sp. MB5]
MNKIINMYYKEFESYGVFWKLNNPILIFSIIFLVIFILAILNLFDLFNLYKKYSFLKDISPYIVLLSEVCFLIFFRALEEQRDIYLIEKYKHKYKKVLTLREIKRKWFENTINIPFSEYASLAEKLDKYYFLEEKYSKPLLTREKFMNYIFATDSKNRVLAMFMGVIALFTGLSIANGAKIEDLYIIFHSLNILKTFISIFVISLIIFLFGYMVRYILLMIINLFDFLFDTTTNMNRVSKRKKEIFIAELIKFHELPKKKHKVYF